MSVSDFQDYVEKIQGDFRGGIATEHTYRSTLEALIETLSTGVDASNDPRHIACGAPDFIVERRKVPIGYVETKDIGVDLDKIEKSDQLKRYFKALNNLILTDYLEFRWYVRGERRMKARIADIRGRRLAINLEGIAHVEQVFTQFFQTETPTVTSAKELASRLAEQTHLVRDLIINALKSNEDAEHTALEKQYKTFCEYLLPALKLEEFADLYAQTMAYGLFAARLFAPESAPFTRAAAYQYLTANKFLRRLFLDVGEELDGTLIAPFLDDIASLLAHADFSSILKDFGKRTRTEDPVVHFYETFLSVYDPKLRESRGVYYTPEPVVQFIVQSVDWLLKNKFEKAWGLADGNVKILDPAAGTATFLYYVIQAIHEEIVRRGQAGTWPQKSKELLHRVFGFELLMAPYVVSHLKLGLLLQELEAPLGQNERLQVYLTNTLEEGVTRAEMLDSLGYYIAEESSHAAWVKKQEEIMVVLGNPPYSGNSANTGEWITALVRDSYYPSDKIKEQNPKLLLDDYVKFIRFGGWRIQQTGHGILAFITNNGYLDNPTFRGMRQNLMNTFDEIYILDLHGSTRKKETTQEGGKDENVFDIKQGVAILLAVKTHVSEKPMKSSQKVIVKHASLWGLREEKYSFLQGSDVSHIEWEEIQPDNPFFLFVPQREDTRDEYENGFRMPEIFMVTSTGIKTHRDYFAVDFDRLAVLNRISNLRNGKVTDVEIREKYALEDTRDWKLHEAREKLDKQINWQSELSDYAYRPFDNRVIYLSDVVVELPRLGVMKHLKYRDNLALGVGRQGLAVSQDNWDLITCVDKPIDTNMYRRGGIQIFPLYLYTNPEETKRTLFAQDETTRRANLSLKFIEAMEGRLGMQFIPDDKGDLNATFGPEDVFHYAYAVFHSPTYRKRYAEFLKIDFPRLPLTSDMVLFANLVAKGEELVGLHLLKSPQIENFLTSYPVTGSNAVIKVHYADGKVWINASQYFGGVTKKVWEFHIGGYQVCDKWLKDRKGRVLSGDDITHYQRVVVALTETIRVMGEVDEVIGEWPID